MNSGGELGLLFNSQRAPGVFVTDKPSVQSRHREARSARVDCPGCGGRASEQFFWSERPGAARVWVRQVVCDSRLKKRKEGVKICAAVREQIEDEVEVEDMPVKGNLMDPGLVECLMNCGISQLEIARQCKIPTGTIAAYLGRKYGLSEQRKLVLVDWARKFAGYQSGGEQIEECESQSESVEVQNEPPYPAETLQAEEQPVGTVGPERLAEFARASARSSVGLINELERNLSRVEDLLVGQVAALAERVGKLERKLRKLKKKLRGRGR